MTIHIIITIVFLLTFLIGSIWYAKKKYQINLAVLGLGAVAFFLSSQILEKLIHIIVLHPQKDGSIALLQDHPLVYIVYGLAMAAFFEETARLIFFFAAFFFFDTATHCFTFSFWIWVNCNVS